MKKSLLVLPITAALLFAGQSLAAPEHVAKEKHPSAKTLKKFDLTDQQKSDMRSLRQQGKQDLSVFKQDITQIEQELRAVIRAAEWDEQAAKSLLIRKQEIKSQLALTRASSKNLMWNNLSEEQKNKLTTRSERGFEKRSKSNKRKAMRRFEPLDLTDNQRHAIAGIMKQQRADNTDLVADKKRFKEQEVTLIRSESFNDDAWQQLDAQQSELDLSLGLAKAQGRHLIWNQLDDAQQVKMDNMAEKRKEKMKQRAKNRM